ncbi:MAG: hypothetical protein M4D80_30070 [Myxococcota bacterium]|nr:hypothetical protein [Myxococcota bacterium]
MRIAAGALDGRCIDGDLRARAFLPALIAPFANRHHDLKFRAAVPLDVVAREHRFAERTDESVVVEATIAFVGQRCLGLAKPRIDLGRQPEAHVVEAQLGLGRLVGMIAGRVPRDELLDLPDVLAERTIAPCGFGRWRRDTRELAHRGEVELARIERCVERRQETERTCDSQSFHRSVRRIPQHALHVVQRRDHPERTPDLYAFRFA